MNRTRINASPVTDSTAHHCNPGKVEILSIVRGPHFDENDACPNIILVAKSGCDFGTRSASPPSQFDDVECTALVSIEDLTQNKVNVGSVIGTIYPFRM